MKLINRYTDYAVRAISYIAKKKNKVVSVVELTQELGIPRSFLRKILQILHREKLLLSYKGQGGGFLLAKPPRRISLIGLMRIFQGELKLNKCTLQKSICPDIRTCVLKKKIDEIQRYTIAKLQSITIASLLKEEILTCGKKKNYKNRRRQM